MVYKSLSFYKERLDLKPGANEGEYWALCPSREHIPPDVNPSLHLTVLETGAVLVHCFKGCSFTSIMQALAVDAREQVSIEESICVEEGQDALAWFSAYTGLPPEFLRHSNVVFAEDRLAFLFQTTGTQKIRRAGERKFAWDLKQGASAPSLWPEVGENVGAEIWLCEGETDTLILRFLGFTAFALTKGADTPVSDEEFESLSRKGVRRVIICLDVDEAGKSGAERLRTKAFKCGLQACVVSIKDYVDVLVGDKDIRAWWLRSGCDTAKLISGLQSLRDKAVLSHTSLPRYMSLASLLVWPAYRNEWLVEGVWVDGNIGVLSGHPKVGKSFLVCDLALSVALGVPFLGEFEVGTVGPVIYIPKEDTLPDLQDRFAKILIAKGYGGKVKFPRITMPHVPPPSVSINARQDFILEDNHVEDLLRYIEDVRREEGRVSLIILDPMLRMLGHKVDLWKAEEVASRVFTFADRLRVLSGGASVIIVHHRPKHSADAMESYGSTAFRAFSESALYLQGTSLPRPGGAEEWCKVVGEFKSKGGFNFWYQFQELEKDYKVAVSRTEPTSDKVILGAAQAGDPRERVKSIIIEVLSESVDPWVPVSELESKVKSRLDVSASTLRRAIAELVEEVAVDKREVVRQGKGGSWYVYKLHSRGGDV